MTLVYIYRRDNSFNTKFKLLVSIYIMGRNIYELQAIAQSRTLRLSPAKTIHNAQYGEPNSFCDPGKLLGQCIVLQGFQVLHHRDSTHAMIKHVALVKRCYEGVIQGYLFGNTFYAHVEGFSFFRWV